MFDGNYIDDKYEFIEVLENVAIIYKIGKEKNEVFDAIHVDTDGVYTGYILKKEKIKQICNIGFLNRFRKKSRIDFFDEFIECGFIPRQNVEKIEGSGKKKVFRRRK